MAKNQVDLTSDYMDDILESVPVNESATGGFTKLFDESNVDSPVTSPSSPNSSNESISGEIELTAKQNFLTMVANCCIADSLVMYDKTAKAYSHANYMRTVANKAVRSYINVMYPNYKNMYPNGSIFSQPVQHKNEDYLPSHSHLLFILKTEFARFPSNANHKYMVIAGLFERLLEEKFCCIDTSLDGASITATGSINLPHVPAIYVCGEGCLAMAALDKFILADERLAQRVIKLYIVDRLMYVIKNTTQVSNNNTCKAGLLRKLIDLKIDIEAYYDPVGEPSGKCHEFSLDPVSWLKATVDYSYQEIAEGKEKAALENMFVELENALGYLFGMPTIFEKLSKLDYFDSELPESRCCMI